MKRSKTGIEFETDDELIEHIERICWNMLKTTPELAFRMLDNGELHGTAAECELKSKLWLLNRGKYKGDGKALKLYYKLLEKS